MYYSWWNCVNMIISSYSFSQASSTTRKWLDNLRCRGTERRLINCPANPIGVDDCTHSQDVALICTASTASTASKNLYIIIAYSIIISNCFVFRPKWRPEAGRQLRPNRRLLWQTGGLLQWTMGNSVSGQLWLKWCKSGLSSTRVRWRHSLWKS